MAQDRTNQIDLLLEKHSLKKTELRRHLLLIFSKAQNSLSLADLLERLKKTKLESADRVSVYRNLKQLIEAGVIHEVDVNSYVFCSHECSQHSHLLLFCPSCHRHAEIKDHGLINEAMQVLAKFRFFGGNDSIFMKGLCKDCAR